jgi:hypothetical protein
MNVHATLRNIVLLLQADPRNYRKFGIWWWPIKALLRRQYSREQLYLLGPYMDSEAADRMPALPLQEALQAALAEYQQNDRYNIGRGDTVEAPDGDPYTIFDPDAGF